jgi:FKBP-type peptidyl-prolyl cis-trans isomerase FkpA
MKHFFLLLTLTTIIASCGKDPGLSVDEYIMTNGLTTTELSDGVHIIIENAGTGFKPTSTSTVVVNYKGTLTDGSEFDSNNNISLSLNNVIRGWQVGLQEIGVGGSCTLIIPASAGYGSQSRDGIPSNSVLVFDIDLLDIIL